MTHTDRPGAASRPAPAVLIACTTRDTCTVATSARLADELRRLGVVVDVAPAEGIETLGGYRGVVLGGTLRAGRWPRTGRHFLDRHGAVLAGLPVWIFEYPATNPGRIPGPRLTDALGGPITLGVTPGGGSVIGPLVRFGAEVPPVRVGGTTGTEVQRLRDWAARIAGDLAGPARAGRPDRIPA